MDTWESGTLGLNKRSNTVPLASVKDRAVTCEEVTPWIGNSMTNSLLKPFTAAGKASCSTPISPSISTSRE